MRTPAEITQRLEDIDDDLQNRLAELETAAYDWFVKKAERERLIAAAFMSAEGSVAERQARAKRDHAEVGKEEEASYEAKKAVMRTLETRASIGMALLKAQK